ncbi:MAG TPA: Hsp70 family protein, partial [Actinomycetales bacterium]|nr:Hsp70 family protein [Actinomycetales bacterium]
DRGNYPVVAFQDNMGDTHDFVPSVVALNGEELLFGFDALEAHTDRGLPLTRSFKRFLASSHATISTTVQVGGRYVPLINVVSGFLAHVRDRLHEASSVSVPLSTDPLEEVAIAVPAHAHGAQRFLTLEAFRRAGFPVVSMVNEPSAAAFEYTHRQGGTLTTRRNRVLVYDLGGGTFDASLVNVDATAHEIIGTHGLNRLGGDDFDAVLASLALRGAGIALERVEVDEYARLLEEARAAKEALTPQTRRILLTVAERDVVVPVAGFYDAVAPLVDQTVAAMEPLVGGLDDAALAESEIAGIYLVGGASSLPAIPRTLRERFGRRVHRSPLPAGSTAVGLAISLDSSAGYSLADRLSRGVGVFRELDDGASVSFDTILSPEERLPSAGTTRIVRRYRAAHNLAWFRFVEYSHLDDDEQPRGDLTPLGDMLFPIDPALRDGRDLTEVAVERTADGPELEESYEVDASGMVRVRVRDLTDGYELVAGFGGDSRS